ncbi:MAG: GPP34 family phosphoprotein [Clostridiales bacterium]|jgi:hypothetical protein|nr:GPP34 family phosphoprotein [Clostridiales bacterium]
MKGLSYTQEYILCAIERRKRKVLVIDEYSACLLAGCLNELLDCSFVTRAKKGGFELGDSNEGCPPHLKPMQEVIESLKRPIGLLEIVLTCTSRRLSQLNSWICDSLVEAECADKSEKRRMFEEKDNIVPKAEVVRNIIEKVRTEFLNDGELTHETECLASLLFADGLISDYFSKYEAEVLKRRLKEVRGSALFSLLKDVSECDYGGC